MKKILLVYGYHKSGHYHAVRALEEETSRRGLESEIRNIFAQKSKTVDQLFTIFRTFAAKGVKSVPNFLIAPEFLTTLANLPFDIPLDQYCGIISTHPYSSAVLAVQKAKQKTNTPLLSVHTDYTPFPLAIHPEINWYVGAIRKESSETKIQKRSVETGIPIRTVFRYDGTPKQKQVLIIGGADGFGELEKIAHFATNLPSAYEIVVLCGRNNDAYERIRKDIPRCSVLGYVEDISPHFKSAPFVITKASGLTITEALSAECIPILAPPILSWEDEAGRYIASQGAGICLPDFGEISLKTLNAIIYSPDIQGALRARCRELARPNAAKEIVDLLFSSRSTPNCSQERVLDDMRRYSQEFKNSQDFSSLAQYLTKNSEEWLKLYEPDNRG